MMIFSENFSHVQQLLFLRFLLSTVSYFLSMQSFFFIFFFVELFFFWHVNVNQLFLNSLLYVFLLSPSSKFSERICENLSRFD